MLNFPLDTPASDASHVEHQRYQGQFLLYWLRYMATHKPTDALFCTNNLLHQAIVSNQYHALHDAMQKQPHDINAQQANGHCALTLACMLGRYEIVNWLLDHGASANVCDIFGNSALHWTTMIQHQVLCEQLLQAGTKPDIRNIFFGTAADYAIALRHTYAPSAAPVDIDVEIDGRIEVWHAQQCRQHLSLEYLHRSSLHNEIIIQIAILMVQPLVAAAFLQKMPKAMQEEGSVVAPILLKHYGFKLGWGVCAKALINKGSYIGSYIGDLLNPLVVYKHASRHQFGHYSAQAIAKPLLGYIKCCIDGYKRGNILTRINSSTSHEEANIGIVMGFRHGLPVVDMYAVQDIPKGRQLCWWYGKEYWQHMGQEPQSLLDT